MRRLLFASATIGVLTACGGDTGTTPTVTPAITFSATATTGTIARGTSSTASLSITRSSSFTGVVTLSAEGLPSGVTVQFAPASIAAGSTTSVATITVEQSAAPGTSSVTLRASGTGVTSQFVTYALTVPTPAITLVIGSSAVSAVAGASATLPITVTRSNGATGISLTATGAPAGVTVAFAPAALTTETASTLTLSVAASTAGGTYPIVISAGAVGAITQNATVQLTVTAAVVPAYSLTATPAALSITSGQRGTSTITATRTGGFTGAVTLAVEGAPVGMTATSTVLGAGTTSTVTLATTAAAVPGTYALTVRGVSTELADRTTPLAVTVIAAPAITVSLAPTTLSIAQGANAQSVVSVARIGGITGDVAMTATGAPTGMTIAFAPTTVTGTSTTALVSVGSGVAAGTYPVVISGSVGSVVGSATLSVAVTVPQSFALAGTAASVAQGTAATSTITISRSGGLVSNVDLSASGLPTNVSAAFNPTSVGGTTSTLTFTAASNAVVGVYTVTVNGTAAGATAQSTTVTLTVTAASTGGNSVAWKFCDPQRVPLWFAFRSGTSGAWTRVTPSADNTFAFAVTGTVGGVVYVQNQLSGGTQGSVFFYSAAELRDIATSECTNNPGATKSLNASFIGLNQASFQQGSVFVGGGTGTTGFTSATAVVNNVPTRLADLIAYRSTVSIVTATITADRAVLRRNVNYPANSAIPVIDVDGPESFPIASATLSFVNAGTDVATVQGSFQTTNGFVGAITALQGNQVYGVPATRTQAGDFHFILASAGSTDNTSFRLFAQYNRDIANRTVTFGSALPTSSLSVTATSPYARIRATNNFTSEYGDAVSCSMSQGSAAGTRGWTFNGSRAYFGTGTTAFEFELPDLSGVSGFVNAWGFTSGAAVQVSTNVVGATVGSLGVVAEGAAWRSAVRQQTITP